MIQFAVHATVNPGHLVVQYEVHNGFSRAVYLANRAPGAPNPGCLDQRPYTASSACSWRSETGDLLLFQGATSVPKPTPFAWRAPLFSAVQAGARAVFQIALRTPVIPFANNYGTTPPPYEPPRTTAMTSWFTLAVDVIVPPGEHNVREVEGTDALQVGWLHLGRLLHRGQFPVPVPVSADQTDADAASPIYLIEGRTSAEWQPLLNVQAP